MGGELSIKTERVYVNEKHEYFASPANIIDRYNLNEITFSELDELLNQHSVEIFLENISKISLNEIIILKLTLLLIKKKGDSFAVTEYTSHEKLKMCGYDSWIDEFKQKWLTTSRLYLKKSF